MNQTPLTDPMIDEATRIFHALSDPSRLKLLRLLMAAQGTVAQSVLAEGTGLSQANASKHLICLAQAGLVVREREGNQALFRLRGPLVREVCGRLKEHVVTRTQSAYQSLQPEA